MKCHLEVSASLDVRNLSIGHAFFILKCQPLGFLDGRQVLRYSFDNFTYERGVTDTPYGCVPFIPTLAATLGQAYSLSLFSAGTNLRSQLAIRHIPRNHTSSSRRYSTLLYQKSNRFLRGSMDGPIVLSFNMMDMIFRRHDPYILGVGNAKEFSMRNA